MLSFRVKMIPPDLLTFPTQCVAVSFHDVIKPPGGYPDDTMDDILNNVLHQLHIAIIRVGVS